MAITRNRREMSNLLARGIGIVLVVALSGLLLAGFSYSRHSGYPMMGQWNHRFNSTACTPPSNLQGQSVNVLVSDMGMMMGGYMGLSAVPSTLTSGKVNVVVTNVGRRTHELVILPLGNGQLAGQRLVGADGKIDETGSVGEVSNNCGAGVGEGIVSGSRGWTTMNLSPGRYEFICNLPNHYATGMYQEIVVNP